jgi:hypothetical protein
VIRFQGTLSDTPVRPLVGTPLASLLRAEEQLGGAITKTAGTAVVTTPTRVDLSDTPTQANQIQLLAVQATGGSYRLTFHVSGVTFQTDPIPYNVSAADLRQIIQRSFAAGSTNDPFLRAYLQHKLDVWVDQYPNGYLTQNIYLLHFQGELRRESNGPGVDTLTVDASSLAGTATDHDADGRDPVLRLRDRQRRRGRRRRRGLQHPGHDEGQQRLRRRGGHERQPARRRRPRVHVVERRPRPRLVERVPVPDGNLDDFRGALNIDLGLGRHRLFMSDEASTHADDYAITGSIGDAHNKSTTGLSASAEIYVTRAGPAGHLVQGRGGRQPLRRRRLSGRAPERHRVHQRDAQPHGRPGEAHHDDAEHRPRQRHRDGCAHGRRRRGAHARLLHAPQRRRVAHRRSGRPATDGEITFGGGGDTDNDTVDASASTRPLVIFGGFGADTITGGTAGDLIFGDFGRTQYVATLTGPSAGVMVATHGFGGRGDRISDAVVDPRWAISRHLTFGARDVIQGGAGEDVLVGGAGRGSASPPYDDLIDGNTGDDFIFGDAVELMRRDIDPFAIPAIAITNPRFKALTGDHIYSRTDLDGGFGDTERRGADRRRRQPVPRRQHHRAALGRVPGHQPVPLVRVLS